MTTDANTTGAPLSTPAAPLSGIRDNHHRGKAVDSIVATFRRRVAAGLQSGRDFFIPERSAQATGIPLSVETILRLHALSHPDGYDSGKFKRQDGEIIEKHPDGRVTVRFKPMAAAKTPTAVKTVCELSDRLVKEHEIPPLIVWAATNLDVLCIHPFRDGNGRLSRLLLLLGLNQMGFTAGRYISLERIIEQSKDRYYETLQQSSQGWHEGKHHSFPVEEGWRSCLFRNGKSREVEAVEVNECSKRERVYY